MDKDPLTRSTGGETTTVEISISKARADALSVIAERRGYESLSAFAQDLFDKEASSILLQEKAEELDIAADFAIESGINPFEALDEALLSEKMMKGYRSAIELRCIEDPRFLEKEGKAISLLKPLDEWSSPETRITAGNLTESMLADILENAAALPTGSLKDPAYFDLAAEELGSCIKMQAGHDISFDKPLASALLDTVKRRIEEGTDYKEIAETWLRTIKDCTPILSATKNWKERH